MVISVGGALEKTFVLPFSCVMFGHGVWLVIVYYTKLKGGVAEFRGLKL